MLGKGPGGLSCRRPPPRPPQLNPKTAYCGMAAVGTLLFLFGGSEQTGAHVRAIASRHSHARTEAACPHQRAGGIFRGWKFSCCGKLCPLFTVSIFRVLTVPRPSFSPLLDPHRPRPCASAGGYSAGLHRLDEDNLHWTDVTAAAAAATAAAAGPNASMPAARQHPGFAAAGDGKLYLYGGMGAEGVFLRRFARLSPRE